MTLTLKSLKLVVPSALAVKEIVPAESTVKVPVVRLNVPESVKVLD